MLLSSASDPVSSTPQSDNLQDGGNKYPKNSQTTVSIIIPTYNERETIIKTVSRIRESLQNYEAEVIVVDDDSPDGTWEVVEENYEEDDAVRVIRRTEESGLGTAVMRGFDAANGEVAMVIDADLQHPPEKLPELLEAFAKGVDIVVGSRYHPGGGIKNWPKSRQVVSKGATLAARVAVPATRGIADPMSGFFAIRSSILQGAELNPSGFKILLEILAKCDYDKVVEVPYVFTEREGGESNLDATEYVNFLEHITKLSVVSYGLNRFVNPGRVVRGVEFAAVGAIGTLVNTAIFVLTHQLFGIHYLLAGLLAFIVALNVNFVGNWALTFDKPSSRLKRKYAKFHATSAVGFAVYSGCLFLLISVFSAPPVVSNIVAIGVGSIANFLGADELAFSPIHAS